MNFVIPFLGYPRFMFLHKLGGCIFTLRLAIQGRESLHSLKTFVLHNSSNKYSWGSKKEHRNVRIVLSWMQKMPDSNIEEILAPLRAAVKEQVSFKLTIFGTQFF